MTAAAGAAAHAGLVVASLRAVAADGALVLMAGGLAMIVTVTLLALVQTLAGGRGTRRLGAPQPGRELRPVEGAPPTPLPASPGRRQPARPSPYLRPPIDHAMDAVVAHGLGEPRLLRSLPGHALVRLYGCSGCRKVGTAAQSGDHEGCHREAQALAHVLTGVGHAPAQVRETACRRRGDPACEFEVTG